ncbi:MAG: hypothetical protein V3T30_02225 [Thermodesulfobacteriota bacterium]
MPGPETTDLLIGGAEIFFNDGSGNRRLGNIPSLGINKETSGIDHFTAESGARIKDKSIITDLGLALNFKIDEFDDENFNALFMADGVTDASYAASSVTDEVHTAYKDRYLFMDFNQISTVVIQDVTDTTTYVAGTDYNIYDAALGIIEIIGSGAIADDDVLHIDYAYAAGTRNKIKPGNTLTLEGSARLEFKALNGKPLTWVIPNCALKVEGSLELASENWSESDITIEVLKSTAVAGEPYGYLLIGNG